MRGHEGADDVTTRLAARINSARKLVVTRDSQGVDVTWGGFEAARAVTGEVVEEIRLLMRDQVVFILSRVGQGPIQVGLRV